MKTNQTLIGDCRETLKQIPANFVQTCITSPPYWGLRDYGTATWEGGDENCDHKQVDQHRGDNSAKQKRNNQGDGGVDRFSSSKTCKRCGAIRKDSQLGLEDTPEEYVESMVAVFREVKRVLRDDGTVWLNLGDSYASNQAAGDRVTKYSDKQSTNKGKLGGKQKVPSGLKPKDLIGIPWRVAFALQADGWYLRQDIIWHKPNPMPESVKDRCTKAHEYIFLLSKKAKYYYDNEAIREPIKPTTTGKASVRESGDSKTRSKEHWGIPHQPKNVIREYKEIKGANKRSVWTVTTKPFKEAHFATFPADLITPCVLAGSGEGDVVLDPFMGSGTTGMVAQHLGRRWLGCELNEEYIDMQKERTSQQSLL